jgi:signal transduction protein with GAF and PtsI domain
MATQTKTPVADSTENVIAFNEKTIEETTKAIEEFNANAAEDTKKAIEESKKAIEEFNANAAEDTKKAIEESQKARFALLDSYESGVLNAVDSYEEIASATDVDWIKEVVAAQARATRELTKAYVSAARDLESQVLALK